MKRIVRDLGLLEKQPAYYARRIFFTLLLLAISLTILVIVDNLLIQIANAAFLAFISTQIAIIGHDAGHRQIARRPWVNQFLGFLHGNLLIGMSAAWWIEKHNAHHGKPNQMGEDPDIDIPFLAFSEEEAAERTGFTRFVVAYQALLILPLLTFEGFHLKFRSVQYLLGRRSKHNVVEGLLIVANLSAYIGLLFFLPNILTAIVFILVHHVLFGIYLGLVFAPNHKGMLVLGKEHDLDFLRHQVLTSRDVIHNPLVTYWYGGLNFQIEHHLFPTMPASSYRPVKEVVTQYCQRHEIDHHVTGVFQSYREILGFLHHVGAPLRASGKIGG